MSKLIFLIFIFIFQSNLLYAQGICNGSVKKINSKLIYTEDKINIWEHVYSYKTRENLISIKFLNDSSDFSPKKNLIWYAPIRDNLPDSASMKHLKHVISNVDVGGVADGVTLVDEGWGLPENIEQFNFFYAQCVKDKYKKIALLARSRGALSLINFVRGSDAPSFDLFIGIYPLINWHSYVTFPYLLKHYKYDEESLSKNNPINIKNLNVFTNKIDNILIIHGDSDTTVPYSFNSKHLKNYKNVFIDLIKGGVHDNSKKFMANEKLIQTLKDYFVIKP